METAFEECQNAMSVSASSCGDPSNMGTTAVAMRFRGGIIAGVESRGSREYVRQRNEHWQPDIQDTYTKVTCLAERMLAISVGNREDCTKLLTKVNEMMEKGDTVSMSSVSDLIGNYLDGLRNQNKCFGILLAGHDESNGFQIYRHLLCGKSVVKENDNEIASLGSGCGFANDILAHGYIFNMSDDAAENLVIKAVFYGTFYDNMSGGTIHAFHLTSKEIIIRPPRQALSAYCNYFEEYNSAPILFLICEATEKTRLLSTDDFVELFRSEGDILAAHRVDERQSLDFSFFFHRLIFTKKKEAVKVLGCPKVKKDVYNDPHAPIISHFPYTASIDGGDKIGRVPVRICEASKELLDFMVSNCSIKNDWESVQ